MATTEVYNEGQLTQEFLHGLFEYREGNLYYKYSPNFRIKVGQKAGNKDNRYMRIKINGNSYLLHRVIFLHQKGYMPKYIDHVNNNPFDNKIENLRECTLSQNQHNRKKTEKVSGSPTTSKWKGVYWCKRHQCWRAALTLNRKRISLGYFIKETDAKLAYKKAASKLHGKFMCLY